MKRTLLILLGVIIYAALHAGVADDGDVKTAPPPRVTPEERKRLNQAYDDLGIPRIDAASTIGCLCKASLIVAVGRIESARENEVGFPGLPEKKIKMVDQMTIRVSETLEGKVEGGKVSFTSSGLFTKTSDSFENTENGVHIFIPSIRKHSAFPETEIGKEVLVFLTDTVFDYSSQPHPNDWNFNCVDAKGTKKVPLQLTRVSGMHEDCGRSMIALAEDAREEVLASVRGYVRLQSSKDAESYQAFLTRQMGSPVQRLRDDALWDMIHFMKSYHASRDDLKKALQAPGVDKRIRGHFELGYFPFFEPNE